MKSIVSCVFSTLLVCALTSTAFAQEDEPVGPGTGEGTLPTPPPASCATCVCPSMRGVRWEPPGVSGVSGSRGTPLPGGSGVGALRGGGFQSSIVRRPCGEPSCASVRTSGSARPVS